MSTEHRSAPSERVVQTSKSRTGSLLGGQIIGVGSAVPDNVVRNEDLAALGYDADWIIQRSGILERRHATPEIATSDLAAQAGLRCLENAGVTPDEVDLVILGTYTPDLLMPSAACLVQEKMGVQAPAFDMHAACASFVYALLTGMQFVGTGCCRRVLVIGADCNSRITNPKDEKTYPLFGDAAGAVLVAPGEKSQGILQYAVGSDGSGADLLWRQMGGTKMPYHPEGAAEGLHLMAMEGRPIFKWAIRMLNETVNQVLDAAGATIDEVRLVIFHQANMRIIASAAKMLGIQEDRIFNNLDRYGNTSSASIPLALDEAYRQERIDRGDLVLFSGFGAGLTWGTMLLRW